MDKVRAKGRKDETEKAAGAAAPLEAQAADAERDDFEEGLLRPKPPIKSRGRGGTGIGRDLDH